MLKVTDAAISVLKREILHEGDLLQADESAKAIRLETAGASDGQRALAIAPVAGPHPGDAEAETEAADLDVFVSAELAAPLDAAILDARETPEGPEMFLREQTEAV